MKPHEKEQWVFEYDPNWNRTIEDLEAEAKELEEAEGDASYKGGEDDTN